jgi:hypothetical protein
MINLAINLMHDLHTQLVLSDFQECTKYTILHCNIQVFHPAIAEFLRSRIQSFVDLCIFFHFVNF